MPGLTVFLAKLIGLYCVLFGLAMASQKQAMVDLVGALMRNGPVLLIVEAIAVTSGLAIVIGHNVRSGGALPVIVTLLGWIILIRGVALLFLSPTAKIRFFEMFRYGTCSISMPGSRSLPSPGSPADTTRRVASAQIGRPLCAANTAPTPCNQALGRLRFVFYFAR
jgi:hypothetical protein